MVSNVPYSISVNKIALPMSSSVGLCFYLVMMKVEGSNKVCRICDSQRMFMNKVLQKINLEKWFIPF